MNQHGGGEKGVSEVVGEMLMIALVILLVSAFAAALPQFLPAKNDLSITILLSNDTENITLWHKGGDWVKNEFLTVIVGNSTTRTHYPRDQFTLVPDKGVFDLGSNLTVHTGRKLLGNETVILVTPDTRIFSGQVGM